MPSPTRSATELRLALVCYGGVSLAIYMHGMTKELHKLVSASRAFDDAGPDGANPFDAATDTRHAYFETLRDLAAAGRLVSVTVDVIAGTSAGGINGVCLAKVLARNGSQDALKQLWIDEGDLKTLLRAPAIGGWKTRAFFAGLRTLAGLQKPGAPLRGDRMSRLLYDAIKAMDAPVDSRRSLLPAGGSVELHVTTTDLDGFPVLVPTGAGGASQRETDHAQVVRFGTDDLGTDSVGALAFAARATSCFPGAFPPVSLDSFRKELDGRPVDTAKIAARFRNRYTAAGRTSDDAWFVDGGVLDNAPFDLVVKAIGEKRAETEVVRRLVYIQPDPGTRLDVSTLAPPKPHGPPGYLPALRQGAWTVKGSHSILPELLALRDMNLRIAEIGAIVRLQMEQVAVAVGQAWQAGASTTERQTPDRVWDIDDPADVKLLADTIYDNATRFIGAAFPTYCRLKVESVAHRLADELAQRLFYPPDSSRSSFVRAALSSWIRGRIDLHKIDTENLLSLLGPVDVPYRERRLMFILAGINQLYAEVGKGEHPARADLDELKRRAWALLDDLRAAPRDAIGGIPDAAVGFLGVDLSDEAVFADPEAFAVEHDEAFGALYAAYRDSLDVRLEDSSGPIWQAFVELTGGWSPEHRRALLSRYLGFPLWDALIFPTIALSELPQFTPIAVTQFSPLAAGALPVKDKLKGVTMHHFGAFTDAAWRENDYLWGRLDAAELILRTLRATGSPDEYQPTPKTPEEAAGQAGRHLRPALSAILASETDLSRIANLRRTLTTQVATLP